MKGTNFKVCHMALALVLILGVTACGKKKNSTNSNNSSNSNINNSGNWSSSQYQDNTNYTSQQSSQIASIKSMNCRNGETRLSQDVIFAVQGGAYNSNTIGGNFQPGSLSGNVSQLYVGISTFNDIMFVSKITNGNSVIGYNVRISLCSQMSPGSNVPFISNQRQYGNFQAPNGITLNDSTVCGVGKITSAQMTMLTASSYTATFSGYSVPVPQAQVQTTFYEPSCGGGSY